MRAGARLRGGAGCCMDTVAGALKHQTMSPALLVQQHGWAWMLVESV